ncbi:phosphotransferase [Planctomonas psychrotolerans]|uniref:phosphotransferase n=1 Tax=Planctomonas psychrotolerans TaxID=2528712 RepID=UPI00123C1548|nr:phosphotransferase [Planctomonas psychrotolerans]
MARSPLTLAALATSAVAGLDVVRTARFGYGTQGDFDSALIHAPDGRELVVRVPTTKVAETEQTADLAALRTLSAGVRARLPFQVATFLGEAPISPTRAYVYELLPGRPVALGDIPAGDGLAASIGRAVAAVHSLPTAFVADAGLPVASASDVQRAAANLVDTASGTGLVPASLLARWEKALGDGSLWQFQPAVVNGSLRASSFLADGGHVTAVLGWSELRVGDPARDLNWVLGARDHHVPESVLSAYHNARQVTVDRRLTQRATLYAELEVARWLLHGTETHNRAITDDAVSMLDALVDSVHSDVRTPISSETPPAMDLNEVEKMLDTHRQPSNDSDHNDRRSLSE